jgi:hypothetical protein
MTVHIEHFCTLKRDALRSVLTMGNLWQLTTADFHELYVSFYSQECAQFCGQRHRWEEQLAARINRCHSCSFLLRIEASFSDVEFSQSAY